MSTYKKLDLETYYRKGVYERFTKVARCSVSITSRIDVTELYEYSKRSGTKFYINFLYLLAKVMNSREDYRMAYIWQSDDVIVYDRINPCQYVFNEATETCTPVYTEYSDEYSTFYAVCQRDIEYTKAHHEYHFDPAGHPNWFDASFIPWISYDSLNVELPDGHLYYQPIVNWGKFREENGRKMMPVTVRMNHAVADGYLISKVFTLLEAAIADFCS